MSKFKGLVSNGQFWEWFWLCWLAFWLLYIVPTLLLWKDNIANLNFMSVMALVLASAAAFQSSLGMRKADSNDKF